MAYNLIFEYVGAEIPRLSPAGIQYPILRIWFLEISLVRMGAPEMFRDSI